MSPSRSLAALKRELLGRTASGARYGLERLEGALEALGHPERAVPVVHVAGTNGKGSVCAMVEAMARADSLRTATFASPHLCRIEERIRIEGEPIAESAFERVLGAVLHETVPWLTFFETMTAACFLAARDADADLLILEVGLGGRLDATNVVPPPRATAITSISRDHTSVLGDDLATIAGEKAGIFKPGAPVSLGRLPPEALARALAVAAKHGAGPCQAVAGDDEEASRLVACGVGVVRVAARDDTIVICAPTATIEARLALRGPYQRDNAGVAASLGLQLGLSEAAVVAGLESARWPGRFERVEHDGISVLFDCAHNEEGVIALAAALESEAAERTILVFGTMADKPWSRMLDLLAPRATRRVYAPPIAAIAGRGPASPEDLAARHAGARCGSPEQALESALAIAAPGDTVVVAGSIFLVGAARAKLLGLDRDALLPM